MISNTYLQTADQIMAYIMILTCALVNVASVSHVTFFSNATSRGTEQTIPGLAQAEIHPSLTVDTQVHAVDEMKLGQVFLQILWLYSKSFHQCSVLMFHLLTILLTPWSRVLLEKVTGSAASQEIPLIFGTRRFITVLTSAHHLSLS